MPTCNKTTLVDSVQCYRIGENNALTEKQRQLDMLLLKALELAALGGIDYSADLQSLATAAIQAQCGQTWEGIKAARMAVQVANTTAAGGSVPTQDAMRAATACLRGHDPFTLEKMDLLLDCLLSKHATV